ncbi:MAG TPA: flagellar hook-basal body protein [Chloroflexota bacterium]
MLRGIYTAAAGMLTQAVRLSTLGNNLSNVETPGYRQDIVEERTFEELLLARIAEGSIEIGPLGLGSVPLRPEIDLSPGPIEATGRALDLALVGDGFFVVQGPDGPLYTRNGAFFQDANGRLVTLQGWPVLGQEGVLQSDAPMTVGPDGVVRAGENVVGQLQVVTFPEETRFQKIEGQYLVPEEGLPAPVAAPRLQPGHLEGSNVNLTSTMTDLLTAARSYQMAQRALTTHDEALGRLLQETSQQV